jgi:hypothetical protein
MEKEQLLARWQVLRDEPVDGIGFQNVLEERLDILHRLNGLGVTDIGGLPIVTALEQTNDLVWKTAKTAAGR